MLVLSRKPGEHILIGEDVYLTVLAVRGESVRLGIEAPRSTPIMRHELIEPRAAEVPDAQDPTHPQPT